MSLPLSVLSQSGPPKSVGGSGGGVGGVVYHTSTGQYIGVATFFFFFFFFCHHPNTCNILDMTRTETLDKDYSYPYCNDVSKYEIIFKIGQGTFGEVFKARESNVSRGCIDEHSSTETFSLFFGYIPGPLAALRDPEVLRAALRARYFWLWSAALQWVWVLPWGCCSQPSSTPRVNTHYLNLNTN